MSTIIEFENISKQYRLGRVGTGTLADDLNRWWAMNVMHKEDPYLKISERNDRTRKAESEYVWALKDINLKIEQGDVVGFIGKNGAGKSTLLKLLSKIIAPTTGEIRARGRIGTLLEVGTGFHPEMTGRENIFMNGAILGMKKQEIKNKLDAIIDFSGCERYIDTPVKRYSSGMKVRLGFAVASFLDPEILVVDEVLSVGDEEFRNKSINKMKEISQEEGRTVLFVSHNLGAMRKLIKHGVLLKEGMIDYIGDGNDCIDRYLGAKQLVLTSKSVIDETHRREDMSLEVEVLEVEMLNDAEAMATDEPIDVIVTARCNDRNIKECQYSLMINNIEGQRIVHCYSEPIEIPTDRDIFKVKMHLENHGLAKGIYTADMTVGIKDFGGTTIHYDRLFKSLIFNICYINANPQREYSSWHSSWGGHVLHAMDDIFTAQLLR